MTCDVSRRYRRSRVAVRNERQDEKAPGGGGPAGCGVTGWLPWRVPVTALVWALTAAVLYGTGAALQQRQAAATPSQAAGRPRLLLLLVRRPWWLLGIGVELGGFATHAVALRTGPLTIVQMLVASSLLFSVATVRLWSGRRLSWTAWAAVLAVIAGIASFVALASPAGGDAGAPGVPGHAGLAAACLATCAVPLAAAGLAAAGSRRAVLLAVAAGLADAAIAVVTMAFSHVVSGGLTGMAGSWATYALMLGGPCSLLLTQTAYQAGRPMITLPVIAVVTPVASLAAGNLLLGESASARRPEQRSRGPGGAGHVGRTRGARPADEQAARCARSACGHQFGSTFPVFTHRRVPPCGSGLPVRFVLLPGGAGEELDEPEGRAVAEAELQDQVRIRCLGLAAREHRLFVGGECRFDVAGVRGDRRPELGAVEHGQVRALAGRRHQVRGIPEERHPGHAVPSVSVREGVDHPRDRCGFAVGDQRGELGRPSAELGRDAGCRGGGVGEVDASEPLGGAVQLDVRVKDAPRLTVRDDAFPG